MSKAQLKMYWLPGTPMREDPLPEGYSFSNYKDASDKLGWAACCRNGLIADADPDEAAFDSAILSWDEIVPERDVFFLDYAGEHVGTVTAFVREEGPGDVHMVGIRSDFRGRGLGKYLNQKAIAVLAARGVPYALLTTDEWRKAAVRSYLTAGFLPVEYAEGMEDRWQAVLEEYGIDSVQMLYEDATPYRVICRKGLSRKFRIGVVGAGRGRSMMDFCARFGNAELVAICDNFAPILERARKKYGDGIAYYDNFEEFIQHDMDAVVLANFANAHAPLAIRCMEAGKAVLSEVLPVQSMAEAVELVETVERTGMVYAYAENYCYMPAPRKIRELYLEGKLGTFEYGEGEYMHNCEPDWDSLTFADPNHWRNTMSAFYYCTHSLGPVLHITGLRPVKVSGFEAPFNARMCRMGAKAGPFGVEIVTLENGAIVKSVHGVGPSKNSVWYTIYGSKGRAESAREDDETKEGVRTLYVNLDENEGDNTNRPELLDTHNSVSDLFDGSGHGGADDYMMYHFIEKLRGNRRAEIVDVYEALDMYLPGHFALRSAMAGGMPMDVPDLRDPAQRDKWRDDRTCTDPAAGADFIPSYTKGIPDIPQENYDKLKQSLQEKHPW